jgi:transposase InsO family protein
MYQDNDYAMSSLNPGSQAPKHRRKRVVDLKIVQEIRRLRLEVCPNMGKDKIKIFLDQFCQRNHLATISASTIGRIIKDKRIYHHRQKVSHFGKIKTVKRTKKLRKPKDFTHQDMGDLVELDTIVKFDWGIKRYIITAVDTQTRYTFAWSYQRTNSKNAKDFFDKLKRVFPYRIKRVQTDNGPEFHRYFKDCLKEQNITHFWNYPSQPYRNGHIEKYNRTIQDEFIDQHTVLLEDPKTFNHKLMDYLIWYNTKRPHWSLGLLSPVDYLIKNNYLSRMCWTDTLI